MRPQDVSVVDAGEAGAIPGKVWMVELIGSERLIEVEIAPKLRITAEVRASRRAAIDDAVAVRPDSRAPPSVRSGDRAGARLRCVR